MSEYFDIPSCNMRGCIYNREGFLCVRHDTKISVFSKTFNENNLQPAKICEVTRQYNEYRLENLIQTQTSRTK